MFRLERRFAEEMINHARQEAPNEACGILAGKDGVTSKLYRAKNVEPSPTKYLMDPRDQLNALLEMEKEGWDLLAIYHSHPMSAAYPSITDVDLAYYADPVYIIVSLGSQDKPEIRAFRIADRTITEEELALC